MDGLLIVDKPAGPTSHDVVARVRQALRERRIGHTGTLDPAASGVLPLLLGRATRLAQFLNTVDKSYEAAITLGVVTDTYDALGRRIGQRYGGPLPSREAIDREFDSFRGTFLQQPPAFSAKRIDGKRSYKHARAARREQALTPAAAEPSILPSPVSVTAHAIDILDVAGDRVVIRVECSAGFYVRALAHDVGERLGTGACLASLRRTRSGDSTIEQAVARATIERDRAAAVRALGPWPKMLPALAAVVLTG
jgi:tRNA pseudouridine55 synthase